MSTNEEKYLNLNFKMYFFDLKCDFQVRDRVNEYALNGAIFADSSTKFA